MFELFIAYAPYEEEFLLQLQRHSGLYYCLSLVALPINGELPFGLPARAIGGPGKGPRVSDPESATTRVLTQMQEVIDDMRSMGDLIVRELEVVVECGGGGKVEELKVCLLQIWINLSDGSGMLVSMTCGKIFREWNSDSDEEHSWFVEVMVYLTEDQPRIYITSLRLEITGIKV
ncbi:hypothetical protein HYFRA_00005237 [Hymenoscyphus fraxineus]|uniref:Uncharacterized protein n=1 Tax=Hymenoscyphus fraxineus TaxID=746836 RepID=A0A9N9L8E3_9HELO|nr:hypothetical protein HYFRA_00005237 [Hymenoscyphus fraxineus]